MKTRNSIPGIIVLSILIMTGFTACQKEDQQSCYNFQSNKRLSNICGSTESFDILKQNKSNGAGNSNSSNNNNLLGNMDISNDQNNIYVTISSAGGINAIRLFYGDCNNIPTNQALYGNLVALSGQNSYTYTIPKSSVDSCACYAARVETNGVGLVTANYCIKECPDDCVIQPGDFKTFGQGGYGSIPHGNNPGMYLQNNFDLAFPTGIQIGCNNVINLTSAYDIMNFLPQTSTPAILTGSFTNPQQRINVLAGQVLTLALNIGFDNFDASFGNASENLQNLVISSGDFQGMSVLQILNESNNILGGCSSTYTPSEINYIVTAINENFEDGVINGGLLICP